MHAVRRPSKATQARATSLGVGNGVYFVYPKHLATVVLSRGQELQLEKSLSMIQPDPTQPAKCHLPTCHSGMVIH
jgi:hypothetical protein